MIDFINDNKHLRLSSNMLRSRYYNYVFTPADAKVFFVLWDRVLAPNSNYYRRGQLVINIKQETVAGITGLSIATVKRCLKKLDTLGAVITIRQRQNNNRYIIGFRTKGNEWLLFLYHLINKFENLLSEYIDEELLKGKTPIIKNIDMYRLNKTYRNYIIENFNSKHFFTTKVDGEANILELMFDRQDFHFTPELSIVSQQ